MDKGDSSIMPAKKTCETCGHNKLTARQYPCNACPAKSHERWAPVPAKPEGVTVEALDTLILSLLRTYNAGRPYKAAAMLRALRPLVEEAACKRAIVAVGYVWGIATRGHIMVADNPEGPLHVAATWPAAADWAEAQAVPKERWSKPVRLCDFEELREIAKAIGATRHGWFTTTGRLMGYVRGYAGDAWNQDTDRVKLP